MSIDQKQTDKSAVISTEQLKEKSQDLLKTPLTEEGEEQLKKAGEILKKSNMDNPEGREPEKAEEALGQLDSIDGFLKNILAFLKDIFKNFSFADLDKVEDEPDNYDEKSATPEVQEKVSKNRNIVSDFYKTIFDKTVMVAKSSLTPANLDTMLEAYVTTAKEQWGKNKRSTNEKQWSKMTDNLAGFKEAFKATDPATAQKIIDLIKDGSFSARLLSKDTVESLQKYKNIDADIVKMLGTGGGQEFKQYLPYLLKTSQNTTVPVPLMIQLMIQEGSHGNPRAKAPSSAYGLGQMTDATWIDYGGGADRNDPEAQIKAMGKRLLAIKNKKKCDWSETLVYYNTGNGGVSEETYATYVRGNPKIVEKMTSYTPRGYMEGARRYYIADCPVDLDKAKPYTA